MDAALAAEELKVVKLEMSRKLVEVSSLITDLISSIRSRPSEDENSPPVR